MSEKKKTQKDILLKVWSYIKRYRILVLLSIVFAGIVVALTLYLPILIGEAIDYIVVHELSHMVEMNHSKRFWAVVEKYMPDYKERIKLLRI